MKVLVVDDDVVSRMMLMHQVDGCVRAEILEAEDGEDAWRLLADGLRPDIVFCDLRMPRLDGLGLLARLRGSAATAGIPFVLVSAGSDAETLEQAGRLGADGYIAKPFRIDAVRAQLDKLAPGAGEDPQAVAHRLGITLERLLVYFAGLRRQLIDARTGGGPGAARLAEGCATLGLMESAALLRAGDAGAVAHALDALERQDALARKAADDSAC
ncbi:PleD family two-component system response regulator [uncultured Massilia sp.]|uniref:response regulator n=1 Tax=uncultured Massilia sp. TaxID=169973 RepID=UPI002586C2F3|nr:response regulator [uncultured Massilia sp.]